MFLVKLSASERMALLDVIAHYMRQQEEPQIFTDCSMQPAIETSTNDLLQAVMNADFTVL